jgi:F-type H+-transporting ATPase subunit epsilon
MAELKFELVSPVRLLISAAVSQVVVPGAEGLFTVLVNHAPVVAALKPGVLEVTHVNGKTERIYVRGGFAEVNAAGLTVLAEEAIAVADLKPGQIAQAIANAEEDFRDAQGDAARRAAEETLTHLKSLQQVLAA